MNQAALVVTRSKERYYNIITIIELTLLHEETGRTSCAQSYSLAYRSYKVAAVIETAIITSLKM